jgi:hypothetical protein
MWRPSHLPYYAKQGYSLVSAYRIAEEKFQNCNEFHPFGEYNKRVTDEDVLDH